MYDDAAGSNIFASNLALKSGGVNYSSGVGPVDGGRLGDVTHGKQKGVKYIIKVL